MPFMRNLGWLATLVSLCLTTVSLSAKGPTTRIVITAPDLASPIEIVDRDVLREFVVWSGPGVLVSGQEQTEGFIVDWPRGAVAQRPDGLTRYEVSFYVKYANRPLESQTDTLAYVVSYEPDPVRGGFIYLPGKGDAWYALNARTIQRGREGQWFHASDGWNRTVKKALSGGR
jgi:hypothetical protein